ncbi:hypothetical protein HAX54_001581, partial [Datura stramonium]|nr:hypothetical protein [Datura stramonium]
MKSVRITDLLISPSCSEITVAVEGLIIVVILRSQRSAEMRPSSPYQTHYTENVTTATDDARQNACLCQDFVVGELWFSRWRVSGGSNHGHS